MNKTSSNNLKITNIVIYIQWVENKQAESISTYKNSVCVCVYIRHKNKRCVHEIKY